MSKSPKRNEASDAANSKSKERTIEVAPKTSVAQSNTLNKVSRPGVHDSSGVHAQPLVNKLEVAAGHKPLSAGLEALCSWAHIVGTEKAPAQFFSPDCKAINIIMQALVNEPELLLSDSKVRVNFVSLLQKVLAVPSAASSYAQFAVKLVNDVEDVLRSIKSARSCTSEKLLILNGSAAKVLADNISGLFRRLYSTIFPFGSSCTEGMEESNSAQLKSLKEELAAVEREIAVVNMKTPNISVNQAKEKTSSVMKQLVAARDGRHELLGLQNKARYFLTYCRMTYFIMLM